MVLGLSFPLTVATLFIFFLSIFYLWCKYKQTYWSRRGIFSPPSNWLFGHFSDAILMRSAPPFILGDLHNTYKEQKVIGIYILQKPFLLIRDPAIIKHVLVKDFHIFPNRYFASKRKTDPVGSTNLFSIDNPQWKYLRTKLSPGLTSGKQKKLFELMVESSENMKNYVKRKVPDDKTVTLEVRDIATKYTTDVISSLTFGIRTNSFEEPVPEFYVRSRDIFDQSIPRTLQMFANFFFPKLSDLMNAEFLDTHTNYFRQIFWESMNEREKSGMKRGDIIDLLLELKNAVQSNEFTFEGDTLLAQSAILFVAGLETSAGTMMFTLLELAKHPEIQKKVRNELREQMTKNKLTYEQISQMSYLNQVVNETLRLYPPAPLLDRIALQDYKIPGTDTVIEKGTVVYVALPGLQTDPEYHPNPLTFDPERFTEARKSDMKPCTYMPFGDGPRICIGMRTGLLQTMVGLITFLSEYEVSINASYKNEVSKRAIFLAPADGIHLNFRRSPVITT